MYSIRFRKEVLAIREKKGLSTGRLRSILASVFFYGEFALGFGSEDEAELG